MTPQNFYWAPQTPQAAGTSWEGRAAQSQPSMACAGMWSWLFLPGMVGVGAPTALGAALQVGSGQPTGFTQPLTFWKSLVSDSLHGNHTRMLEVEDPFALKPSEDLDLVGQERYFSVKTFSRQKGLDSEKMKFCEFISIPQIVELGRRGGKRKCFTETFSKQNVSEVSFLGPVFGFRTSFSFSKKIKFF